MTDRSSVTSSPSASSPATSSSTGSVRALAHHAPVGWRLWLLGLLLVAVPFNPYVLPILSAIGLFLVWSGLNQQASTYYMLAKGFKKETTGRHRAIAFLAGLALSAALMEMGTQTLDLALADSPNRLPILVIALSTVGSWMFLNMFRWWWKLPYTLTASLVMTGAGSLSVWQAYQSPGPELAGMSLVVVNFVRFTAIFGAAAMIKVLAEPKRPIDPADGKRPPLWPSISQSVAFIALLAMADRLPDQRQGWVFLIMLAVLAALAAMALGHALLALRQDLSWLTRLMRGGWPKSGTVPAGVFITTAFLPALTLAPLANWSSWATVALLGMLAASLKAFNERLDIRLKRKKTRPQRRGHSSSVSKKTEVKG